MPPDGPCLHALLAADGAGRIDVEIVSELSRIGRKISLMLGVVEQLARRGWLW
jgi:hypothetical protein